METNKILLVDVDSKYPNIALMKLSGFYKSKGYRIDLIKINANGQPTKQRKVDKELIDGSDYEKIFVSIIFTQNKNVVEILNNKNVEFGGSGYDLKKTLPKEVDDFEEDYSLYDEKKFSYGFITRGCIRHCNFCIVPEKEGMIYKYREVKQVAKTKNVIFMDNNILAYKDCNRILLEIIDLGIRCQFNQGLDLRLIDEKKAELLSKIKYIGEYFFAFDDIRLKPIIEKNYKIFKKYVPKDWKVRFYVYCNAEVPISDVVERVNWCKENKALVFLMRDKNCWASENSRFYSDLASYCQSIRWFKNWDFVKWMEARTKNQEIIKNNIEIYYNVAEARIKPFLEQRKL